MYIYSLYSIKNILAAVPLCVCIQTTNFQTKKNLFSTIFKLRSNFVLRHHYNIYADECKWRHQNPVIGYRPILSRGKCNQQEYLSTTKGLQKAEGWSGKGTIWSVRTEATKGNTSRSFDSCLCNVFLLYL